MLNYRSTATTREGVRSEILSLIQSEIRGNVSWERFDKGVRAKSERAGAIKALNRLEEILSSIKLVPEEPK